MSPTPQGAPALALRPGTAGTRPRGTDTARESFPGPEVLPYPRGWSPAWPAGTAEGCRGCAGVAALPPSCHPWNVGLAAGHRAVPCPSSMSCSIPAACPGSSSSGKLLSLWNAAGLEAGSQPAPLSPAPLSHHVRSFFKYGFYFEHLCDFSMEKKKPKPKKQQQKPQTSRLSNDCKLFKYIYPWNKNPVSGVCFLHSLCSARGKEEAGGAMDDNQEKIWGCGGSSGFGLSWGQPLP